MKKLALLLLCVSALCASTTTVTQSVVGPDGQPASGLALISINTPCASGSNYTAMKNTPIRFVGGAFSVSLVPNDTCLPAGTSYSVRWQIAGGSSWSETWVVPTSGSPVSVASVVTQIVPTPSLRLALAQLAAGGAVTGQPLCFNGSFWAPGSCGGSGTGSVIGPNSSQAGFVPVWGNPLGTLLGQGYFASSASAPNAIPIAGSGGTIGLDWLPTIPYSQITGAQAALGYSPEDAANRAIANGYAPLDGNALLPLANLPTVPFSQLSGAQAALGYTPENVSAKGAANGYAPLNSSSLVALAFLPTIPFSQTSGVQASLGFTAENLAHRGAASGYAPLDSSAFVPLANLKLTGTANALKVVSAPSGTLTGCAQYDVDGNLAATGVDCGAGGSGGGVNGPATTVSGNLPSWDNSIGTLLGTGFAASTAPGATTIPISGVGGALDIGWLPTITFAHTSGIQASLGFTAEDSANRNAANGYAPLDASARLPVVNLPTAAVTSTSLNNNTLPVSATALTTSGAVTSTQTGAGAYMMKAGGAQTPPAGYVGLQAPASVPSAFNCTWWGVPVAGLVHATATAPCILSPSAVALADLDPSFVLPFSMTSGVQAALGYTAENASNRGAASGYAPLNSSSQVPLANIAITGTTAASKIVSAPAGTLTGCAQYDVNGNLGATGSDCGAGGSGSGDVSGPGSSVSGFVPAWGNTIGTTLTAGFAASTTPGANTIPIAGGGATISLTWLPTVPFSKLSGVQASLGYTAENTAAKGAASGYAPLDSGSKVPIANIPTIPFTGVSGINTVAQGGTGTATPGLVAGANVGITGSWPNQTITSTGGGVGNTYQLGDTSVAKTSNTVLTIAGGCGPATPCNVRFGSQVFTLTNSATATLSAGSGTAFVYISAAGVLTVGHNVTVSCNAGCVQTPGITSFPIGSIPLWQYTAVGAPLSWTTGIDKRSFVFGMPAMVSGLGVIVTGAANQYSFAADPAVVEQLANKGAASGYAPLNSSGVVPSANLPGAAKTGTCVIDNDTQSSTVLSSAQFTGRCEIPFAATIVEVGVWGGTGTGSQVYTGASSVQLTRLRPNGGGTATLLSGALVTPNSGTNSNKACAVSVTSGTCINGLTSSGSVTIANTTLQAGDLIYVSSATADSVQTWYTVTVTYMGN